MPTETFSTTRHAPLICRMLHERARNFIFLTRLFESDYCYTSGSRRHAVGPSFKLRVTQLSGSSHARRSGPSPRLKSAVPRVAPVKTAGQVTAWDRYTSRSRGPCCAVAGVAGLTGGHNRGATGVFPVCRCTHSSARSHVGNRIPRASRAAGPYAADVVCAGYHTRERDGSGRVFFFFTSLAGTTRIGVPRLLACRVAPLPPSGWSI